MVDPTDRRHRVRVAAGRPAEWCRGSCGALAQVVGDVTDGEGRRPVVESEPGEAGASGEPLAAGAERRPGRGRQRPEWSDDRIVGRRPAVGRRGGKGGEQVVDLARRVDDARPGGDRW